MGIRNRLRRQRMGNWSGDKLRGNVLICGKPLALILKADAISCTSKFRNAYSLNDVC